MYMYPKTIHSKEYLAILKKLVQARNAADITQAELGERLNRSQSYISKIENGQLRIDILQLKNIAVTLGKELKDFLE